jgi:hypothetical protein
MAGHVPSTRWIALWAEVYHRRRNIVIFLQSVVRCPAEARGKRRGCLGWIRVLEGGADLRHGHEVHLWGGDGEAMFTGGEDPDEPLGWRRPHRPRPQCRGHDVPVGKVLWYLSALTSHPADDRVFEEHDLGVVTPMPQHAKAANSSYRHGIMGGNDERRAATEVPHRFPPLFLGDRRRCQAHHDLLDGLKHGKCQALGGGVAILREALNRSLQHEVRREAARDSPRCVLEEAHRPRSRPIQHGKPGPLATHLVSVKTVAELEHGRVTRGRSKAGATAGVSVDRALEAPLYTNLRQRRRPTCFSRVLVAQTLDATLQLAVAREALPVNFKDRALGLRTQGKGVVVLKPDHGEVGAVLPWVPRRLMRMQPRDAADPWQGGGFAERVPALVLDGPLDRRKQQRIVPVPAASICDKPCYFSIVTLTSGQPLDQTCIDRPLP